MPLLARRRNLKQAGLSLRIEPPYEDAVSTIFLAVRQEKTGNNL